MAGPQENQGHGHSSPEPTETARPRRRQKRAHVEDPGDIPTSRKSKTCSICRRLKVKCDLAERGTTGGCSRCQRIGLRCLSEKRSWTAAADGDEWYANPFSCPRGRESVIVVHSSVTLKLVQAESSGHQQAGKSSRRCSRETEHAPIRSLRASGHYRSTVSSEIDSRQL
jgi:hypothetical protein